jgi:hypothetical protein
LPAKRSPTWMRFRMSKANKPFGTWRLCIGIGPGRQPGGHGL